MAGKRAWLQAEGVDIPEGLSAVVDRDESSGFTGVWLAVEGVAWGAVFFSDAAKPAARATVDALRQQGNDVVLLTGDSAGATHLVAAKLGI
jgi:Cation transport ATPase